MHSRQSVSHVTALLAVGILLAVGLWCGFAAAAVAKRLGLEQLVAESVSIVRGQVLSSTAAWDNGQIWTSHQFRVQSALRGNHRGGDLLTVKTLGGVVGEIGQHVCGEVQLVAGEDVYLFLWRDPQQRQRVFGLSQGKFRVIQPPASTPTAEPRVENSYDGLVLVDPTTGKKALPTPPLNFSISDFETRVRQLANPPPNSNSNSNAPATNTGAAGTQTPTDTSRDNRNGNSAPTTENGK